MKISAKFKICLILSLFLTAFLLLTTYYQLPTTYAQAAPCPSGETVINGLISATDVSSGFGNSSGTCVVDPDKAPFRTYFAPDFSYDGLKKNYFTDSKAGKTLDSAHTNINLSTNKLYNYTASDAWGEVTLNALNYGVNSSGVSVIFIDNNLRIKGNITGSDITGLVLVVKKNVLIEQHVQQIDAVIISTGYIYTAVSSASSSTSCSTSATSTAKPLVINGSLISLGSDILRPGTDMIKFCRNLVNNRTAAEQIIQQPKYLVLLKELWSDTLEKWSEVP